MRSLALVLVLTLSCADASSSFAASGATNLQAGARLEEDWILAVHSGGVDRALPDPRDAGLRRALQLLDDRLLELAVEQRGFAPPPELTGLALEWLSAPWTLHLGARPPVDPASAPEFRAQLVLHVPEDRAGAWAERLRAQLATFGMSSAESSFDPDLIEVPLPMGTLYYGASELGLAIAWGRSPVPTRPLDGRLPGGATTGLSVDLALGRLIDLARATGAPGDPLMDRVLPPGGDLEVAFTAGHDARGALFHLRYRGWVSTARAMGLLDETPLARTSFDLVPADATIVTLSRLDLGAIAGLVKDLDARTGQFATGSFERATGLPLEALFAPLGGTVGWYLSDSTGAGGLNSLVFLATLDDEDGMRAAIGGLADRATLVGAGHVRVRRSPRDSGETFALEFPGLPVPLELALAVDSGHLFAAASPQALEVALRQARRGKGGLTEHPALRGLARGALDGLQGFSFLDNARLLRDGYPSWCWRPRPWRTAFARAMTPPAIQAWSCRRCPTCSRARGPA